MKGKQKTAIDNSGKELNRIQYNTKKRGKT